MLCTWSDANACLKIFKAIQHTNPIVNITFDTHGIHVMAMDTSKTSLVKLDMTPSYFTSYTCTEELTLGIYTESLCNILQKVKKNTLTWSASQNILSIRLAQADQTTEFSLRAIDIEEDHLDIPELEDDVAVTMDYNSIKDIMDKLLMGKTEVRVDINQHKLQLSSESTEFGKITHSEPIGGERVKQIAFRNEVSIGLSFHAIKSVFIFSSCGTGPCFLGFSNEMPSRLKVGLGPGSFIALYVAPKINE